MNKILLAFILLLSSCERKRQLMFRITTPEGVFEGIDYKVSGDSTMGKTTYRIKIYKLEGSFCDPTFLEREFICDSYSVASFYKVEK